jgi:hypothetical protein
LKIVASSGPLFDQFLIIGLKNHSDIKTGEEPSSLFRFPFEDTREFPGIENLGFPSGTAKLTRVRRTLSSSNLFQILSNQKQFTHGHNSFVFLLTTETGDFYYGVSVLVEEPLSSEPVLLNENPPSLEEMKYKNVTIIPDQFPVPKPPPGRNLRPASSYGSFSNENPEPPTPEMSGRVSLDSVRTDIVKNLRPKRTTDSLLDPGLKNPEKGGIHFKYIILMKRITQICLQGNGFFSLGIGVSQNIRLLQTKHPRLRAMEKISI